ncbi:ATP-binding protein, partial [Acinetobacter baumannii]
MEEQGLGAQEASRQVRYALYQQVAEEVGASKVVLAHHGDDQVETVLFRMLRGTSIHGLSGIPTRRWLVAEKIEVVRP